MCVYRCRKPTPDGSDADPSTFQVNLVTPHARTDTHAHTHADTHTQTHTNAHTHAHTYPPHSPNTNTRTHTHAAHTCTYAHTPHTHAHRSEAESESTCVTLRTEPPPTCSVDPAARRFYQSDDCARPLLSGCVIMNACVVIRPMSGLQSQLFHTKLLLLHWSGERALCRMR